MNISTPVAVYLAEDPDDSSKGYFKKKIIPYCEEVLKQMKKFLEDLKKQLWLAIAKEAKQKVEELIDFKNK